MTLIIDKHGNEVERRYEDYFRPLTAYQLAQAFPEERALAINRKRQLLKELLRYDDAIDSIYISKEYSDEEKRLLVVCVETWKSIDPATRELKTTNAYLRMTRHAATGRDAAARGNPVTTERELLNIEKAKAVPIWELFNPDHLRETSAIITCRCPFHHERTPSFTIYKKSNRFKCFGCGKSGDSIHFYMTMHNVDFKSAVRSLT